MGKLNKHQIQSSYKYILFKGYSWSRKVNED